MIIKTILFCLGACYVCHTMPDMLRLTNNLPDHVAVHTLSGQEVLSTRITPELCAELDAHKQAGLNMLNHDLAQRILRSIQQKNELLLNWITAKVVFTQPNENAFNEFNYFLLTIFDAQWRVQTIERQFDCYENMLNHLRESGIVPKKNLPEKVSVLVELINNERRMRVTYWYVPKRRMGFQYWHVPNNDCTTAPLDNCGAELLKSTKFDFRPDTFGFMEINDQFPHETFYLLTGPFCDALEMVRVATKCVDTRFANQRMILDGLVTVVHEPTLPSVEQSMKRSFEPENILRVPYPNIHHTPERMDCRSLCTIT